MTPNFQTTAPARLVAPGRILRRELEARGWEGKDLAEIMARPPQMISQIMTGKKRITEETALQIGEALEMDPAFWLNLEKSYRLGLARKAAADEGIARRRRLRELVPCWREVVKRGWLPDSGDLDELERSVCEFLEINNICDEPEFAFCRRHGSDDSREKRLLQGIWAKRVEQLAAEKTLPRFSKKRLLESMPDLLTLAVGQCDVEEVPAFIEQLGIAFCIVPHLEKTRLEGAAWPKARNPILALTLRYDRLDSFWFNLLHELGHIALGHEGVILDTEEDLSGSDIQEQEANEFAARYLRREEIAAFWNQVGPAPPKAKIVSLAHELHLNPSIVVGQLRNISGNYTYHRGLDINVRHCLTAWIDGAGA